MANENTIRNMWGLYSVIGLIETITLSILLEYNIKTNGSLGTSVVEFGFMSLAFGTSAYCFSQTLNYVGRDKESNLANLVDK